MNSTFEYRDEAIPLVVYNNDKRSKKYCLF